MQGVLTGVERRLALLQMLLGGTSFAAETLAEALVIGTLGALWMPVGLAGSATLRFMLMTGLLRRPVSPRRLPGLAGATLLIGITIWMGLFLVPTVAALIFLLMSRPSRDVLNVTAGNAAPLVARIAPEALVPLLRDQSVTVRRAAALAAGMLPILPAPVADALLATTGDNATSVRAAAVASLCHLGLPAILVLVIALDDPVSSVRAAATGTLLEGDTSHARTLALQPIPDHNWGQAEKLAILTRWTPWRWRTALLTEEGIGLTDITQLAMARVALGKAHGPVGALLRRDVDDEITEGLVRWEECLRIADGAETARVIVQGLAAEDSVRRAQAQEALEAVRSPAIARQAVGLLAPIRAATGAMIGAYPSTMPRSHTSMGTLDILLA